jgi:DNA (cytosine-5)-methyltransferase 1
MKINHLDLFSGIGGFHLGFERAGFKIKSYFSEIDKHAIAVYKHKFKDATYVGSVTDVHGGDLPRIDLITFGSPCQDFSLAGKRAGMGGDRSSLILEAIRLVRECRPRVFIWENVKGAFSSNSGEDFAAILQEFADIGGYRLEWQLLNTSWFLPQNRERIYLVGYSTTPKRGWRGVFPIREAIGEPREIKQTASLTGGQLGRVLDPNGIGYSLSACDYKDPMKVEIKQIGTRLDSGGKQPYQQDRIYDSTGHAPALNAGKSDLIVKTNYTSKALNETIENSDLVEGEPQALDLYNRVARNESPTLTEPHHNSLRMFDGYRIRRLTPIECERLQGFPDDHTEFGNYDGEVKPVSNTQRYKQCGNAVTVDVVSAVAKKCIPLFK